MRNIGTIFGLLVALALTAAPASAFEQTAPASVPSSPGQASQGHRKAPVAPGISTATPTPGQTQLAPDLNSEDGRGGIKIPGFGSFNFLPKMDFGLELLYGEPPKVDSPVDPLHDQDVTIRGSVKRRF